MSSIVLLNCYDATGKSRSLLAYDNLDGTYSLSVVGTVPVDTHDDLAAILAALPATLGTKSAATSLAVALSTEDTAKLTSILARLSPGTHVGSSAREKSHIVSAAPCVLRSAKVGSNHTVDLWLMIFDAVSNPGNGTAPNRAAVLVEAGTSNGDKWEGGTTLAVGCFVALSSTSDTLTLVGSDVGWFDAEIS